MQAATSRRMRLTRRAARKRYAAARRMAAAGVPKIVYVSCDPATQARDIAVLTEKGYRAEKVQGVDMFPWTEHVETVVLLSRQ